MSVRKAFLGAASLLALTASGGTPGEAAISSTAEFSPHQVSAPNLKADFLLELAKRVNGSVSPQVIEQALKELISGSSAIDVEALPEFLVGLSHLGLPANVVGRARQLFIESTKNAIEVDEYLRETVLSGLRAELTTFQLAQNTNQRRRRDPDEVGQVPGAAPPAAS